MKHPLHYQSKLSLMDTQVAIKFVKDRAERDISAALSLLRVTAPIILSSESGLNDDLSGKERKVTFSAGEDGRKLEVVQSLAKWKRMALQKYGFREGTGLYADMNALRRDEREDCLHSLFVDQWDWEQVITKEQRTLDYLKDTVCRIAKAISQTKSAISSKYPCLSSQISEEVSFVTALELYDRYPHLSPEEREYQYVRDNPVSCIIGIGAPLPDGRPHSMRAPDYDDWTLNCDIFYWSDVISAPIEISSMGIRVDSEALKRQLACAHAESRMRYPYHTAIAQNQLPYTIGGGIGQSRLCMLLLEKAHIGEVQVSAWGEAERKACDEAGIFLL